MGKSDKASWEEMVDLAIHTNLRTADKVSRQKINAYITDNYRYDMTRDGNKSQLKKALEKGLENGHLVQDKASFLFSPQGKKHFEETYEVSEEEEEDEEDEAASSPSTKKAAAAGSGKKRK
ncbi:hypothetical protein JCM10207_003621 [Rhodosporidiobolus poonsookiae]